MPARDATHFYRAVVPVSLAETNASIENGLPLLSETQPIHDNPDFFDAVANIYAASRDRIGEMIGRGNFKRVLLILLLVLAIRHVR